MGSMGRVRSKFNPELEWLAARRELLKRVKRDVRQRLGPEPADVTEYAARYERELRARYTVSSKDELLSTLRDADIVYGGDFHALGQAQRTHLKVLRGIEAKREVTLALECFPISSQKWLDAYLAGEIGLDDLFLKSEWEKTWGFPRENYGPLLEIAKRRSWKILALNRRGQRGSSLKAREKAAARVIAQHRRRDPRSLIYVIFGDLHLAQEHLPAQVRRAIREEVKDVIVHLNSERIYFQLAKKGLEHTTDVVRFRDGSFCVLASPPWVQWQSYLLFLERTVDTALEMGDDFDPTDQVVELIRLAGADLGIKPKTDDVSVLSSEDARVWKVLEEQLGRAELEIARDLLARGKGFYLPGAHTGFLGRSTINHAGVLAGQYLHAKLSGLQRTLWRLPVDFTALIWAEAAAYFVSKLVNHKRQSETLTDLKAQLLRQNSTSADKEVLKLSLDRLMSELVLVREGGSRKMQFQPRRKSSYLEAARICGGMLGERLYIAYRSRKLKKEEIVRLLRWNPTSQGFSRRYENLLKSLAQLVGTEAHGTRLRIKSRPERL